MGVETLFEWLFKEWKRLPAWLRNGTYIAILLFAMYLSLFPNYLDGSLRTIGTDGGERTFLERGQIELDAQGRRIIVGLDENADWHVPLTSRLPFKAQFIAVRFNGLLYPVRIPYLSIVCSERVVVAYTESARPPFSLRPAVDAGCWMETVFKAVRAGESVPRRTDPAADGSATQVDALLNLIPTDGVLSPAQQSELADKIESTFHTEVTRSAWQIATERKDLRSLILNCANPTIPARFGTKVEQILKAYLPERDLYVGLANIPADKLASALRARATSKPTDGSVVALLDGTVLGSASIHLLFTADGMYFRNSALRVTGPREGFIDFRSFPRLRFAAAAWQEVGFGTVGGFDTSGSTISAPKLIQLLNDLKTEILTTPRTEQR